MADATHEGELIAVFRAILIKELQQETGRGGGEGSSNASTFRDQRTWTRNALLLAMPHYATDECPHRAATRKC